MGGQDVGFGKWHYCLILGLTIADKESFYGSLQNIFITFDGPEMLLISGDFNGHIGKASLCYEGIQGGYGFGNHHVDVERILGFAVAIQNLLRKLVTLLYINIVIPKAK